MTKTLDNQIDQDISNIVSDLTDDLSSVSTLEFKKSVKPKKVLEVKNDDSEFTTSPDGKYKIPKPKKHADFLNKTPSRIPYVTDESILKDYHIYWQTDEKPHQISDMISQGYEFVDNNVSGYENSIPTHSGYRPDCSAYMSYCFRIPISKYKEIERIRQNAISAHEQEMQLNPNKVVDGGGNGLYATDQMKMGVRSHSPKYS